MSLLDLLSAGLTAGTQGVTAFDEGRRLKAREDEARTLAAIDRMRRERREDVELRNLESLMENRGVAGVTDETFGTIPREVIGPDGKPMYIVFGNRGTQREVRGYRPPEEAAPRVEEREENGGVAIYENGIFKRWKTTPPQQTNQGQPTEGERKAAMLLTTGQNGYETLERLLAGNRRPPSLLERAQSNIGMGIGNVLSSAELQQIDQAAYDLQEAWLRLTSGAVISPDEIRNSARALIPQPGDSPQVLEQKRQARAMRIAAIRQAAGRAVPQSGAAAGGVTTSSGRTFQRVP